MGRLVPDAVQQDVIRVELHVATGSCTFTASTHIAALRSLGMSSERYWVRLRLLRDDFQSYFTVVLLGLSPAGRESHSTDVLALGRDR